MIRCKMYEARTAEARIVTLTQRRTTRLCHSLMVDSRGGGSHEVWIGVVRFVTSASQKRRYDAPTTIVTSTSTSL